MPSAPRRVMPRTIALRLAVADQQITHQVNLSDDEVAVLVRFRDDFRRLTSGRFVQRLVAEPQRLVASLDTLQFETTAIDDDDFAAFLHRYRPLVLQKEPWSFRRVRTLLGAKFAPTPVATMLREWDREFDGDASCAPMTIAVDGRRIDSHEFLTTWLNAYEYHRDEEKRGELDGLRARVPAEAIQAAIVFRISQQLQVLGRLADLSTVLLEDGGAAR